MHSYIISTAITLRLIDLVMGWFGLIVYTPNNDFPDIMIHTGSVTFTILVLGLIPLVS